ncbi:hypothetical protein BHE74_00012571 [Ensete ventricosum]|nr:hypothetical protein GW17_00043617 [Ensete ventricosum]RWW79163.1 hypothetical protein BHE74_00012571 [Ensete ventricosum]RZR91036.1 hypothetical protein BHM03_00019066 [Ensete ventricosum]
MCGIGCESLLQTKIALSTSSDTSTLPRTKARRKIKFCSSDRHVILRKFLFSKFQVLDQQSLY